MTYSAYKRDGAIMQLVIKEPIFKSILFYGDVTESGVRRGGFIGSWWGNRKERDHWGDLGVGEWIILGWISRRWDVGIWTGLGWIGLAQDRDRWRTLVSAIMTLRVP